MKPTDIRPTVMNVMPRPRSGPGTLLYRIFSRIAARAAIARSQPIPEPTPKTVASASAVGALLHEERGAQDRAVHRDQRQEDAERVVELGHEPVERHLHDLDRRRDRADEREEAQEAEIGPGNAPGMSAPRASSRIPFRCSWFSGQVSAEDEDDREPSPIACLDLLGDGQEGAHPQEEGQGHVLNEDAFVAKLK